MSVGALAERGTTKKSNGVAGFRYSRVRGLLYVFGMLLKLPFVPLWPLFVAWEARDWSLCSPRRYLGTFLYMTSSLVRQTCHGSIGRLVRYNLMDPGEIAERIEEREGACVGCAKCCRTMRCLFLDEAAGRCRAFGTNYWYYGTCGRYPLDAADIDSHACPGFSFRRRVS